MKDTCKTNKIPVIRQNPIKYQRNGLALAWHRTAPPIHASHISLAWTPMDSGPPSPPSMQVNLHEINKSQPQAGPESARSNTGTRNRSELHKAGSLQRVG